MLCYADDGVISTVKKQLCYSNLIKVQGGQNLLTLFHFVFLFLLKKPSVMVPTGNVVTQKFV